MLLMSEAATWTAQSAPILGIPTATAAMQISNVSGTVPTHGADQWIAFLDPARRLRFALDGIMPGRQARAIHVARNRERLLRKERQMKKFLVLYRAPTSAFDQMRKATPEQQKAGMDSWMAWSKKVGSSIVDMGAPLGKSLKVTKGGGASPTTNDLGGYSIMQADSKEALAEKMSGHPHFMMQEGIIEIVELMPMPGM